MYKRSIFGYRTNERIPFQSIGGNADRTGPTNKLSLMHKATEARIQQAIEMTRSSVEKKKLVPLTKNGSVGKVTPSRRSRFDFHNDKKGNYSLRGQTNVHSLESSVVQEAELRHPPKPASNGEHSKSMVYLHRNVFDRLSNRPGQSLERQSRTRDKTVSQNEAEESAFTLKVKSTGLTPKPQQTPPTCFSNTTEYLMHEYQLENIKQKSQIETLKVELKTAENLQSQKSTEIEYLTKKTIDMATTMAKQESEIASLRQQLAMAGQSAQQSRIQTSETQVEVAKLRDEFQQLKTENLRLTTILNEERAEKERLAQRLAEKDLAIQTNGVSVILLEKERNILLSLVERLKAELGSLRESNHDAMSFLLKSKS